MKIEKVKEMKEKTTQLLHTDKSKFDKTLNKQNTAHQPN